MAVSEHPDSMPGSDVTVTGPWPGTVHLAATHFSAIRSHMVVAPVKTEDQTWTLRIFDSQTQTLLLATPNLHGWTSSGWGLPEFVDPTLAALALEVAVSTREPDLVETWTLDAARSQLASHVSRHEMSALDALWALLDGFARRTKVYASTARLRSRVPGLIITNAGGAHPFQAEGSWAGHDWYFRYRYDVASLRVGGTNVVGSPLWSAETSYESGYPADGEALSWTEFENLFCLLAVSLTKAPFHYLFAPEGSEQDSGNPQWGGYGNTPEEAYQSLLERVAQFEHEGYITPGLVFDPRPLNIDDRAYPVVPPVFVVHPSGGLSG